jgi:hypothetical protein
MSSKAKCPKCGEVMAITEEMFGQTASCPVCGATIRVPAKAAGAAAGGSVPPGGAMPGSPPPLPAHGAAAGPPPMPPVDTSGGSFVDSGPGGRRPLDPKMIVGGIAAVGVFVLIALGLALLAGGGAPDAIRYMPADAQLIASVDVGELLGSGLYEQFANESPQVAGFREEMMNVTGLKPEDVRRLLVGAGPDNMIGVAELNTAMDVAAFVEKQAGRGAREEKVGEATIHVSGRDAFHFPDNRTFVFGKAPQLRQALDPQRTAGLSPKIAEMVGDLDFGRTIAVAFVVAPGGGLAADVPMAAGIADQVQAGVFHADVGSDLRLDATLYCKDGETATNMKEMVDGLLAAVKQRPDVPDEIRELTDSLSISVSGSRIRARVTVSKELIDQASKQVPPSTPF